MEVNAKINHRAAQDCVKVAIGENDYSRGQGENAGKLR
jgi:hypothetical protein